MKDFERNGLWEEMRLLRPMLFGILRRYGIGRDDWEDLIQETIVAALLQWERIECLKGWCVIVLRNKAIEWGRRRKTAAVLSGGREEFEELVVEEAPQLQSDRRMDYEAVARRVLSERARRL